MADGICMLTHVQITLPQVPVFFIVFDSLQRYENACVDETILLRFRRDENRHFRKRSF